MCLEENKIRENTNHCGLLFYMKINITLLGYQNDTYRPLQYDICRPLEDSTCGSLEYSTCGPLEYDTCRPLEYDTCRLIELVHKDLYSITTHAGQFEKKKSEIINYFEKYVSVAIIADNMSLVNVQYIMLVSE